MPRIGLIVQARMGSKRLPGKSMMPLAGEPLVFRVLERLKRVQRLDHLILAIPDTQKDDSLEKIGLSIGANIFRGSESDLLGRYHQAARKFGLDIVLRIPADNVASEPIEIEKIINFYLRNSFDFCSNLAQVYENGYPDGIGAEIFSFSLLEQIAHKTIDPEKREHVHLNFFDYKKQEPVAGITVGTIECDLEIRRPDVVLDINTQEQYQLMSKMYNALYPSKSAFGIREIIKWWDENVE